MELTTLQGQNPHPKEPSIFEEMAQLQGGLTGLKLGLRSVSSSG